MLLKAQFNFKGPSKKKNFKGTLGCILKHHLSQYYAML
jgi:hypothetical protein